MTQGVKAPVRQAWPPGLDPLNPLPGGRREVTSQRCPLMSTYTSNTHIMYTYIITIISEIKDEVENN